MGGFKFGHKKEVLLAICRKLWETVRGAQERKSWASCSSPVIVFLSQGQWCKIWGLGFRNDCQR